MVCNLRELKVKKVSFVRRGANKKQFFLAKSAGEDSIPNNQNSGGAHKMRPEIKKKLAEILKGERNADKVCVLLKSEATLKITEDEVTEVREFIEMFPPAPAPKETDNGDALRKAQSDLETERAARKAADERIAKIEEDRHQEALEKWLGSECPHLPVKTEDAIKQILAAEKAGEEVAKTVKENFKATSKSIRESSLLKEIGRGGEGDPDPLAGGLIAEVLQKRDALVKDASEKLKSSDVITLAIKSMSPEKLEAYRDAHIRRAGMRGSDMD